MSTADFMRSPWGHSHADYEESPIHIRPAPETATGEVVLASVMRSVGFGGVSEGAVPRQGREFDRVSREGHRRRGATRDGSVSDEAWDIVLHGLLESPKQVNQSTKRFLSLSPVVPDAALYSGSARLSENSWNPGELVRRMVSLGAKDAVAAQVLWQRLFAALTVDEGDDVWARWLHKEFVERRRVDANWALAPLDGVPDFTSDVKGGPSYPARQFVHDLDAILAAKSAMTRRQWTSLLESILRIGVVSHVLWLCHVNHNLWLEAQAALRGEPPRPGAGNDVLSRRDTLLSLGNPSAAHIKELVSRYLGARLGINALLWELAAAGKAPGRLDGPAGFRNLISAAGSERDASARGVLDLVARLREDHARTLSCKKNIGSNMFEFARYVLGQRQTANDALRNYDQGYFQRRRQERSPWRVSIGPAALLALVHCCLHGAAGPRSIQRLSLHLAEYGLLVDPGNIADGELGQRLRELGLVLDSPDAESGMLLVPPFRENQRDMEAAS